MFETNQTIEQLNCRAAKLLAELVQCPSVNAAGDSPAQPDSVYGEKKYTELLARKVSKLGGTTEITEYNAGRTNFVGRFEGRDRSRSVTFEAHADTVSHLGMTIEPFGGEVADGRLYGRGSCDTKGSMAAMLIAMELLQAQGTLPACDINIVSTFDEEVTGTGIRKLLESGFTTDAAIVGEPTGLDIIHAAKGSMRYYITTFGRAAHSSSPEKGVNAITNMAKIIAAIDDKLKKLATSVSDEILGTGSVSIGVISGGSQVNIVPDRCSIDIDRRLIPQVSYAQAVAEMDALLKEISANNGNFKYEIRPQLAYPPFVQKTDAPLVQTLANAARQIVPQSQCRFVSWSATAGVLAEAGIAAVLFGPGDIAQAHTADEYIEIEQVTKAALIYAEIMSQYIPEKNNAR